MSTLDCQTAAQRLYPILHHCFAIEMIPGKLLGFVSFPNRFWHVIACLAKCSPDGESSHYTRVWHDMRLGVGSVFKGCDNLVDISAAETGLLSKS